MSESIRAYFVFFTTRCQCRVCVRSSICIALFAINLSTPFKDESEVIVLVMSRYVHCSFILEYDFQ